MDKPRGPTSFDIVAQMRRRLSEKRIGHAGTLDPMATGLLVILVGEATKLEPYLSGARKTYVATVKLGAETTSGDAEGDVVSATEVPSSVREALAAPPGGCVAKALAIEVARSEQVPPSVSAIHVDGERSHVRVRRGEHVTLPPRPVEVRSLAVLGGDPAEATLTVRLEVSKGYYVRAFARDLGASLGVAGHLVALRRERSGDFSVDAAAAPAGVTRDRVIGIAEAVAQAMPTAHLTAEGERFARQGKGLTPEHFVAPPEVGDRPFGWVRDGALVAIGAREDVIYRVLRGFSPLPPLPTPSGER